MGGMVLETNMNEILTRIEEQNKIEKEEVRLTLELPLGRFKSVGVPHLDFKKIFFSYIF